MDVTSVSPVRFQEIVAVPGTGRREQFAVAANQTLDGQVLSVEGDTLIIQIGQQRVFARQQPEGTLGAGEAVRLLVRNVDPDQVLMQIVARGTSPSTLRSLTNDDLSGELARQGVAADDETLAVARALINRGVPMTQANVVDVRGALARLGAFAMGDLDAAAFLKGQGLPVTPDTIQIVRQALASPSALGAQVEGLRQALADLGARLAGLGVSPARAQPAGLATAVDDGAAQQPSQPPAPGTQLAGRAAAASMPAAVGAPAGPFAPPAPVAGSAVAAGSSAATTATAVTVEDGVATPVVGSAMPAATGAAPTAAAEVPFASGGGAPPAPATAPPVGTAADGGRAVAAGVPQPSVPVGQGAPTAAQVTAGQPAVVAELDAAVPSNTAASVVPTAVAEAPAPQPASQQARVGAPATPPPAAAGSAGPTVAAPTSAAIATDVAEGAPSAQSVQGPGPGPAPRPEPDLSRLFAAVESTLSQLAVLDESDADTLAYQLRRVIAEHGTPVEAKLARILEGIAHRGDVEMLLGSDLKASLATLVQEARANAERPLPPEALRDLHAVQRQAESLLSRVELQQMSNAAPRTDAATPGYLVFQLPIPGGRDGQTAQIRIRQEGDGETARIDPKNVHVVFQLELQNLATVRVGIRVQDRHVSCQMGSSDAAATALLAEHSPELREGLAGLGYLVDPVKTAQLTPEDLAPPPEVAEPMVSRPPMPALRIDARA